jgi:hypothetical protein
MDRAAVLAARQVARTARLRGVTVAQVRRAWARWQPITAEAAAGFRGEVVPVVAAAQSIAVAGGLAYVAQQLAVEGIGAPDVDGAALAATLRPADEVVQRSVIHVRSLLAAGVPVSTALARGLDLAERNAAMDVALANRAASAAAMAAEPRIVGYRRVPDGGACVFCLMASTQRYGREELMPLHHRCGCDVAPIFGDADPGQVIDRALLDRLKGVTTTVTFDAELGPVLSGSVAA